MLGGCSRHASAQKGDGANPEPYGSQLSISPGKTTENEIIPAKN